MFQKHWYSVFAHKHYFRFKTIFALKKIMNQISSCSTLINQKDIYASKIVKKKNHFRLQLIKLKKMTGRKKGLLRERKRDKCSKKKKNWGKNSCNKSLTTFTTINAINNLTAVKCCLSMFFSQFFKSFLAKFLR